jgi:hypothetical protein
MKGEQTIPTTRMKTSSRTMVVIVALLAATIVTVGMAIPIVKPAYAQLDDISEQIGGEITSQSDIREKVEEITSQSLPTLSEQATALFGFRGPPALAG